MNFLTLGLRSLKIAEKAKRDAVARNEYMRSAGLTCAVSPEDAFEQALAAEGARLERAMEIGMGYFAMAKTRLGGGAAVSDGRWYMLTVRPPPGTDLLRLKETTEAFVATWGSSWEEYEYAFEQKGETLEELGKGCHVHLVLRTSKSNYYPSHILRDAKRAWPWVAANCIQCDALNNVARAKAYIRGDKGKEEKLASAAMDSVWRQREGLLELYESGQVQTALIEEVV